MKLKRLEDIVNSIKKDLKKPSTANIRKNEEEQLFLDESDLDS